MGRNRKSGKRERSGRLSRRPAEHKARQLDGLDREQQAIIGVAIEARQRVWGLTPGLSRDQMAGSYVGRCCLAGDITRSQYDAAMSYIEERSRYSRAMCAPRQPGAIDLNAARGGINGHEDVDRTLQIAESHRVTIDAIRAAQLEIGNRGNLWGAVNICIDRDQPADHLVGDLRLALNALVRRYGLAQAAA